jgi:hypothetical protein
MVCFAQPSVGTEEEEAALEKSTIAGFTYFCTSCKENLGIRKPPANYKEKLLSKIFTIRGSNIEAFLCKQKA